MSTICAAVYFAVQRCWLATYANSTPGATTSAMVPATSSAIVSAVALSATKSTAPVPSSVAVVGATTTATACVVTSNITPSAAAHRAVNTSAVVAVCGARNCVSRTSFSANRVNATTVPAVAVTDCTAVPDPSPAHTRRTTHGASPATVHDWPYIDPATSVVIPTSAPSSTENAAVVGGAKNTTSSVYSRVAPRYATARTTRAVPPTLDLTCVTFPAAVLTSTPAFAHVNASAAPVGNDVVRVTVAHVPVVTTEPCNDAVDVTPSPALSGNWYTSSAAVTLVLVLGK